MELRKPHVLFVIMLLMTGLLCGFVGRPGNSKGKIWPSSAFAPDGQSLLLSIYYRGSRNIYRVRKDGAELKRLTFSRGSDIDPVYSPDGSKIVFASAPSTDYGAEHDLYLMDADGSNRSRLTSGPAHDFAPSFSPDGKRVYFVRARWFGNYSPFVSSRWHDMDLYSINVDGSSLKQITDEWCYEISTPSISPDGHQILARLKMGGVRTRFG